jgi:hypothetical protein
VYLTATEVDSSQKGSNPSDSSFAFIKVRDECWQKDTESVGDTVHDEVTEERRHDNHPAPSTIRRHWNIMDLKKGKKNRIEEI